MKVINVSFLGQEKIKQIKEEVKLLKNLRSDRILRYYEDHEDKEFYLIFTEKCVITIKLNF